MVKKATAKITTVAPTKAKYKALLVTHSGRSSVEFLFMNTRTAFGIKANQVTAWNNCDTRITTLIAMITGLPRKFCKYQIYGATPVKVGAEAARKAKEAK